MSALLNRGVTLNEEYVLHALYNNRSTVKQLHDLLLKYVDTTFQAESSVLYYLKSLTGKGLITCVNGVYELTFEGVVAADQLFSQLQKLTQNSNRDVLRIVAVNEHIYFYQVDNSLF